SPGDAAGRGAPRRRGFRHRSRIRRSRGRRPAPGSAALRHRSGGVRIVKPGRPTASIDIDGRLLHADESALLGLTVEAALGCHDPMSIAFWPGSKCAGVSPAGTVKLRLGTKEDGDEDVCAGEITSARRAADAVYVDAVAPTIALSRTAKSQTYLRQSIGDI